VKEAKKQDREKIFLKSGVEFTPELEERLVAEERGYDLAKARRYRRTRPLLPGSPIPGSKKDTDS